MSKSGPIVIIEDDEDDKIIFEAVVKELGIKNRVLWFPETKSAYEFLASTNTIVFLILCDINLPGKNGIEFKAEIDENPEMRKKSIPFIFYSTAAKQEDVNEAYTEIVVQGFFKKGNSYSRIKDTLETIFEYWKLCKHPNNLR